MKSQIQFFLIYLIIPLLACGQSVDEAKIHVTAKVQQELFPVIAKFVSEGNNSSNLPTTVVWDIENENESSVEITLISELPDWTSPSIKTIELKANESRKLYQTPFGIKLLRKHSTVPATIILKAKIDENIIYEESKQIKIRSADEMIWSLETSFDTAPFIASWVTPNNDLVERILSNAKEKLWNRQLSGYQSADITPQVKAIFNAVRNAHISYVNSTSSFGKVGFTQRVRLPEESILQKSANCIDGAVLFASLFENIGLEPLIVLVPGHAFVGVRDFPNSSNAFFIETTMVGRRVLESILTLESTFNAALREGTAKYNNEIVRNPRLVHIIDIKKEREKGIYPLW